MKESILILTCASGLAGLVTLLAGAVTLNRRLIAWGFLFGMLSLTGAAILHLAF